MDFEEFEELKASSIGHSLIKAARLHNEMAFSSFKSLIKYNNLKPSHLQLFAHIPFEGITVVELASKMQISKQAVSVMVKELLAAKLLIKKNNPDDKRSFLITFSQSKSTGIMRGMKHLKEMDNAIVSILGKKQAKQLQSLLDKLILSFQ